MVEVLWKFAVYRSRSGDDPGGLIMEAETPGFSTRASGLAPVTLPPLYLECLDTGIINGDGSLG